VVAATGRAAKTITDEGYMHPGCITVKVLQTKMHEFSKKMRDTPEKLH
jgi:hypothetical protein